MYNLLLFFFLLMVLSMIIMKISLIISKKTKFDSEKMSPFECGFDPIYCTRMPFSIRFFLITIIFLIFDVELVILIPMIKTFYFSIKLNWLMTSMALIFILLIGIYHEWNQGVLNWSI